MSSGERQRGRERAATKLVGIFDSEFLRALTEPARLDVLRVLLVHGPSDVATVASHLPQDRSVVSRHLRVLEGVGILQARRDGRHRIYEIDGAFFVEKLEEILSLARSLAPQCCPTTSGPKPGEGRGPR